MDFLLNNLDVIIVVLFIFNIITGLYLYCFYSIFKEFKSDVNRYFDFNDREHIKINDKYLGLKCNRQFLSNDYVKQQCMEHYLLMRIFENGKLVYTEFNKLDTIKYEYIKLKRADANVFAFNIVDGVLIPMEFEV